MDVLYLKALGLGLAGFDPSGALIAMAFLAAGATRRAVFLFCVVYLTATIALLSIASIALSTRVPGTRVRLLDNHPQTKAVVELLLGIGLLAFAAWRLMHAKGPDRPRTRALPVSPLATAGAGLLLAAGVIGDPALLAFAVVAATAERVSSIVIAQAIAVLASKALVVVVMAAVGLGSESLATDRLQSWWKHAAPVLGRAVSIVLVGMATVLVANALWWFRTGSFLL